VGTQVFALHPHLLDHGGVSLVDAPYLLATLAPDSRAHAPLPT
jgi:hypothetical protein